MRLASVVVAAILAIVAGSALAASADTPPNPSCAIKGNITDKGERIYHLPGDPWYARTKVDVSKGEKWLCSEKEALAAGWRSPKR